MWRIVSLVLVSAALMLGALTTFRSPDWAPWQLALLAGEYGHWLVPPLLAVAALQWRRPGTLATRALTATIAGTAAALLLQPCCQASRIGRALPPVFARQFPSAPRVASAPFSLGRLFARGPERVPATTLRFADDLALDFYAPPDRGTRLPPVVVVVHGGGWDGGERGDFALFSCALTRCGYAVAAVSYRLAPRFTWPAQRDDVLAAIKFLEAHARQLGIDASRIVLLGRSAGGQIAEAVGYATQDPAIRGIIAFYAPADLEFAWSYGREDDVLKSPHLMRQFLGGPPAEVKGRYRDASGIAFVSPRSPPTLLLHGELDPLVWHRQSERLAARLASAHVPHVFVSLPWATHAFDFNLRGPGGQLALWSVEQFLSAVTSD